MTRGRTASLVLLLALLISMLLSLCLGAGDVSLPEALFGSQDSVAARILYYVRLPRMLAAVLAGASLSVAGLLLQTALGNPLAAPSIVGVNSGAGLAVLCCTVLVGGGSAWVSVSAFAGACLAVFGVYMLASVTGVSKTTIILAGVSVSGMLSACMDAIVTFVPDAVSNRSSFSIGGFSNVNMNQLRLALPLILIGLIAAVLLQREMEGRAVVAVLHDLGLAMRYADRVILMQDGKILMDGTSEALYESGLLERVFRIRVEKIREKTYIFTNQEDEI